MSNRPTPAMYDVIRVPASSDGGGLEVVEATGNVPLAELFDVEEPDGAGSGAENAAGEETVSLR